MSEYDGDLVRQMCMFPYNLQLQHYMSKMGHQKLLYFANHSYREHRSIVFRSLLFYSHADGRCGQMSVEYDQVRLAAIGI